MQYDAVCSTIYNEVKRDYEYRMSQFLNSQESQRHQKSVEKAIEKAKKCLPSGFEIRLEGYGHFDDQIGKYMMLRWEDKKVPKHSSDTVRRWVTMNASEHKTLQEIRKAALAHFKL